MHARESRRWGLHRAHALVLLVLLALLALCAMALLWLTHTERGLRVTADAIERVVSEEIPGWMEIGQLERVGRPTIVRNLQFFHPKGTLVLLVKRAEIDFDVGAALSGELAFERATADGGHLLISIDPDGRPSIEAALDFPSHGPDPDPHGGLHYAMRDIRVSHFALPIVLSEETSYRVQGVQGVVTVRRELTSGTRVELRGISGRVREQIASTKVRLLRVDGWVHGKERQVLQLDARTRVDDGRLNAKLALFDRKKTPVEVVLTPVAGFDSRLGAFLIYARALFTDGIDVKMGGS